MERTDYQSGKIKSLLILAAGLFLAALAASVFILMPSKSRIVQIVQDDEVLYTIDLASSEDMVFTVFYPKGSSNVITVEGGEIRVSEAECPDHTCMRMGRLRSKHLPIVCLPNHLIIRFAE